MFPQLYLPPKKGWDRYTKGFQVVIVPPKTNKPKKTPKQKQVMQVQDLLIAHGSFGTLKTLHAAGTCPHCANIGTIQRTLLKPTVWLPTQDGVVVHLLCMLKAEVSVPGFSIYKQLSGSNQIQD